MSQVLICTAQSALQKQLASAADRAGLPTYTAARADTALRAGVTARHLALVVLRDAAQAELKRLEDSERRIKALFIDGKLSLGEYRELLAELNTRLADARKKVRESAAALDGAVASVNQQAQSTLLLDRVNEWEQLTHPEQKQLLRHFISHIVAHRDKQSGEISCEVVWNWDTGVEQCEPVHIIRQGRSTARSKAAAAGRKRVSGRFAAADQENGPGNLWEASRPVDCTSLNRSRLRGGRAGPVRGGSLRIPEACARSEGGARESRDVWPP